MRRRRRRGGLRPRVALPLVAAGALAGCTPRTARDVILVTLDTVRADRLGCYGATGARTPTLDALAREATLYTQAACQVPITTPSHATILTGLLPPQHGVRDNGTFALPASATTLAERLGALGFRSHAVLASFAVERRFGLAQGFDDYDDRFGNGADPRAERPAGEVIDRAVAWIREAPGPAFLWVHLYDPHHPYTPPPPFDEEFRDRPYDGEIAYLDRELGRLFATLRDLGRWRDALIVVVADHGEALGEHGERYHGMLLYDATLRVPLLVKWPRQTRARRVEEPAGTQDVVPTVLAAVGAEPDPALAGRDLRRLGTGADAARGIYAEALTAELHYGWTRLKALRDGRYKLIEGARVELYDHRADPGETRDLAPRDPDLVAQLRADLAAQASDAEVVAGKVDVQAAEKLAALGYVSAGGSSAGARAIDAASHVALQGVVLDALDLEATAPEEAAALYRKALEVDPGLKLALVRLGDLEDRAGRLDAALALYRRTLDLYPDVEMAYRGALGVLGRKGDLAAARDVAREAVAALPHADALRVELAALEADLGDRGRAGELLEQVDPEGGAGGRACYLLARLRALEGDRPRALELLKRAVRKGVPGDARSLAADPAFASMRETPEFLILLESYGRP